MKRVLVTGGAGFIGSHLVDALVARGQSVNVLDDLSSGCRKNLEEAEAAGDVEFFQGTVLSEADVSTAMEGCNRVFHLAVQCVRRSLGDPMGNHDVNATGTMNLLENARRFGIERFIYCSSSEVYGNTEKERLTEDKTLCAPVTVYGAAKLAGEYYTKAYYQTYGLPAVIVRPFNSYGPREHEQGDLAEVIPRFVIRVLNGYPPVIFGSGSQGRDFTYVTETAEGLLASAECDELLGDVVNIAFGEMVSINKVAATICRLCQRSDLVPEYIDPRPGDVNWLLADTARAENLLDYKAQVDFETGISKYLQWFSSRHEDAAKLFEKEVVNWTMPKI